MSAVAALPVLVAALALVGPAQTLPELPRAFVDTALVPPTGRTITVAAGGDLQAALDQAQPGDVIELQSGASFTGGFVLPNQPGTGWIQVRTSALAALPAPGARATPADVGAMATLVSPGTGPVLATAAGAHHYRFIGLEITTAHAVISSTSFALVVLEAPGRQSSLSQVPSDLVFDRCYIHGTPAGNVRRGIAMNSARTAVIDSYLADFHERGADSQAIGGWNGPGPFKIANCYLEGAGENVMFGGADPDIPNLVPSDIEIRRNHCFKPLAWRGSAWTVKNLFELKNAQRVLIDGNVLEQNWVAAQNGYAILFTVRNQNGAAPWSVVQDVTFTHNVVRHVASAVNVLGFDDIFPSRQTRRVLIADNVFEDVGTPWGGAGSGRGFQLLDRTAQVVIDHNTVFHDDTVLLADGGAHEAFVYRNNLSPHNLYGIGGTGTFGNPGLTLSTYFPGAQFAANILSGGSPARYPPGNFFPPSLASVGFVSLPGGNYRLASTSAYRGAGTDGKDIGADIDALEAAIRGGGRTDILWRHTATGDNVRWAMNGTARIGASALPPVPDPAWQIGATADFDGDGHSDIVWRHAASGSNAIWWMNGATPVGAAFLPAVADPTWRIAAAADFNGDAQPDLVWRHAASGVNAVWFMQGAALIGAALLSPVPDPAWTIAGAGDFSGDEQPDLLWRNAATGDNLIWFLNGTALVGGALLAPLRGADWRAGGVGDFNLDGKPDILWRDEVSGSNLVWFLDRTAPAGQAVLPPVGVPGWRIAGLQ